MTPALSDDVVSTALRDPVAVIDWPLKRWDDLIRHARGANLLARLARRLEMRSLLARVPSAPLAHLESSLIQERAQRNALNTELDNLGQALEGVRGPIVLLKGGAYLAARLPAAEGRLFSDVDILVRREELPAAESALMLTGWASTHHNAYDQRYYRKWMHELPPLRHVKRLSVVDVHHAILPITARLRPDSLKLLTASVPLADRSFHVLAPMDMILHSATHLFHNEEMQQGLRDLSDLDSLLRQFLLEPRQWTELVERGRELDLLQPLYYGLRYARHFFDTPVPSQILAGEHWRGADRLSGIMDRLFIPAIRPTLTSSSRQAVLARKLLYVRAHWLRMPAWLLAYHLTVKLFRSEEPVPA